MTSEHRANSEVTPLPPGCVLLHIGPHKTGTSTLQEALKESRDRLELAGVTYMYRRAHREFGPLAVVNRPSRPGLRPPSPKDWADLIASVARNTAHRVVVSSERYSWADEPAAARILDDLDRSRVHVVVTLRALDRILPSQWQMTVQGGRTATYDEWLRHIFSTSGRESADFWLRHAHGELVERWVRIAGAGNLTVIVVDPADRMMLLDTIAAMLDLPAGFLPAQVRNRSLTAGEIEMIRHVNLELTARGWPRGAQAVLVRAGISPFLSERPAPPAEKRITTPRWAAELAAVRAEQAIATIASSGARIVGDLGDLRVTAPEDEAADGSEATVPATTAAATIVAAVMAAAIPDAGISWDGETPQLAPKRRLKDP